MKNGGGSIEVLELLRLQTGFEIFAKKDVGLMKVTS